MSNAIDNQNPLVSIMMPSANDRDMVTKSILLFFNTATNPDDIEVILRIDNEAGRSQEWINDIRLCAGHARHLQIKVMSGPQKYGYCSIPQFFDEIAATAKGEFLLGACDDITDINKGWDDNVRNWKGKCVFLTDIAEAGTHYWDFWVIHRKIFELVETISITNYCNYFFEIYETYLPELVKKAGFKINHRPTAEFGYAAAGGLGLNCDNITAEDYRLNKDDYFPNQEGTKMEHFIKHYVPRVGQFVKDNPEFNPNVKEIVDEAVS